MLLLSKMPGFVCIMSYEYWGRLSNCTYAFVRVCVCVCVPLTSVLAVVSGSTHLRPLGGGFGKGDAQSRRYD